MSDIRANHILSSLTRCLVVCVLLTCASPSTLAQRTGPFSDQMLGASSTFNSLEISDRVPEDPQPGICGLRHFGQCLKDIAHDQAGIWTSPLRMKSRDALWLVPFAAGTGVALHYDAQAQQELGVDKT